MSNSPSEIDPLDPTQIALVKKSWKALSHNASAVTHSFYKHLFQLDERMKSIFENTDMESQEKKFADTITVIVKGLDQFEMLGPAIGELGKRHSGYGVSNEQYAIVKSALMDALEAESPSGFDQETRDAWISTYDAVSAIMRNGSSGTPITSPSL
jgi:hemoglobin-like flavoprotein